MALPVLPSPTSSIVPDAQNESTPETPPVSITDVPSPIPSTPTAILSNTQTLKTVSCEDLPVTNNAPVTGAGTVLYFSREIIGVGAISLSDLSQGNIFEGLGVPALGAKLSPERNKIAYYRLGEDLMLFDLIAGTTTQIPYNENWSTPSWSQDGRLLAHTTGDSPLKFYYLDPLTLEVEEMIKPPGWPDVAYSTTNGLPGSGFIAVDPTETFAIYTEMGINTDYMTNFVLTNIQNGSELWRNIDVGVGYYEGPNWYAEPKWNEAGSQAILVLPQTYKQPYTLILSLTADGQETEIVRLSQLPGEGDFFQIRYLEWSSDQRFIHFSLFETPETGPGYILDTYTKTIYEICEPNFIQGWWLPAEEGGHLLYLAAEENGEQTLNLLDVTTWQSQQLLVTDNNFRTWNVIGWTPIEFSN
jgi:hypothetical protein